VRLCATAIEAMDLLSGLVKSIVACALLREHVQKGTAGADVVKRGKLEWGFLPNQFSALQFDSAAV
jgi:hypothetical protein